LADPYLRRFAKKHFPKDTSSSVLDLGCGTGALLNILACHGFRGLEGVDCSPQQVGRKVSKAVRLGDGLSALKEKGDASVDVVVCFDVIEHLVREELLAWALHVRRVLKPGGRWIVHVPNSSSPFGSRVRYADLTHELAFTRESITQLAELGGFSSCAVFEDRPVVHGAISAVRRLVWTITRIPFAMFFAAETGEWRNVILSQNMVAVLYR
jgi:2-polyprenyl-3-methyl-5-hydroxy-6-metoxy-1,4-benzoquinol methylase